MAKQNADVIALAVLELDDTRLIEQFRDARGRFIGNVRGLQNEAEKAALAREGAEARVQARTRFSAVAVQQLADTYNRQGLRMVSSVNRVAAAHRTLQAATIQSEIRFATFTGLVGLAGGELGAMASTALIAGRSITALVNSIGPWGYAVSAAVAALALLGRAFNQYIEDAQAAAEATGKAFDAMSADTDRRLGHIQRVGLLRDKLRVAGGQITERDARERALQAADRTRPIEDIRREVDFEERLAHVEARKLRYKEARDAIDKRAEEQRQRVLQAEKEITDEARAQLEVRLNEAQAATQQAKSRARGLAVRLGLATEAQFETDPRLRRIAEIEAQLGGPAAASGGQRFSTQGFGRVAIQPGVGVTTRIGERREQDKVEALKKLLRNSEDIKQLLEDLGGLG